MRTRRGKLVRAGFTMLELMVVIAIILVLLGLAAVKYQQSILHAKETALKHDLVEMRIAIENYTLDKQAAPQSLDDLVSAHYLREIPKDPITQQRDWRPDFENVLLSPEQSGTGISDVHSSSDQVSPFEHTPYSSW
jgi:general secretion pathway protein G